MRHKRADSTCNGVTHDPKKFMAYRAWVKSGCKLIRLGDFLTLREAALAADFSRYLLWGPDPRLWYNDRCHRMQKPPNGAPVEDLPFDRQMIMRKLLASGVINAMTLADNLTHYCNIAAQLAMLG